MDVPSAEIELHGTKHLVPIPPKTFSTGSVGYYYSGKLDGAEGKRYQASIQLVEIGSKNRRNKA